MIDSSVPIPLYYEAEDVDNETGITTTAYQSPFTKETSSTLNPSKASASRPHGIAEKLLMSKQSMVACGTNTVHEVAYQSMFGDNGHLSRKFGSYLSTDGVDPNTRRIAQIMSDYLFCCRNIYVAAVWHSNEQYKATKTREMETNQANAR